MAWGRPLPSRISIALLAGAALATVLALILGASRDDVDDAALGFAALALAVLTADYLLTQRAWNSAPVQLIRRLPPSFALGVAAEISVRLDNPANRRWQCRVFDHADSLLRVEGLPVDLGLPAAHHGEFQYRVRPERRGELRFEPAELRLRSLLGLLEIDHRIGELERRRVYPNFLTLARLAWLSASSRLNEIGIKAIRQRGTGTDFKQLNEYQSGDPIRHIDWKASRRLDQPVVRQFQDERDQRVMLLLDCGRRMRADDREARQSLTHFDEMLNAVLLLAYVALKHGDSVGVMTFGHAEGEGRSLAPAKGLGTIEALMSELYALQPSFQHSDYLTAARAFMRGRPRRSLVVLVTNFRDEDDSELRDALRLLRSRHLVMVASLREEIVREIIEQPLRDDDAVIDVASAHFYEQNRRAAFGRLAARDALMVDAEPRRLGAELVNRYNSVKQAGLL